MEVHRCRGTTSAISLMLWVKWSLTVHINDCPLLSYPPSPPLPPLHLLFFSLPLFLGICTHTIYGTQRIWGWVVTLASTEISKSTFWSFKTLPRRKFLFIGPFCRNLFSKHRGVILWPNRRSRKQRDKCAYEEWVADRRCSSGMLDHSHWNCEWLNMILTLFASGYCYFCPFSLFLPRDVGKPTQRMRLTGMTDSLYKRIII